MENDVNNELNVKVINFYNFLVKQPSDINEHLPVLLEYANKCKHITELGVRWFVSTYPFVIAKPNKLVSIDIKNPLDWEKNINVKERMEDIKNYSKLNNIDYSFLLADTLKTEIEETDLLFIDTLHVYQQLNTELNLHGNKAKKYLIFHDTSTYGFVDEIHEDLGSVLNKNNSAKKGIIPAIKEFLDSNEHWSIDRIYENCNGLVILKRN